MDLREMRYILEIYRTKSMSKAAAGLYISQPALHKALHKIEDEYDAELFYHDGRELLPTDIGKIVIGKSREILEITQQMNDSITAAKELKSGEISIGFPSVVGSIYLPEVIIDFQNKYPGIILHTQEGGGADLLRMTKDGELDAAIVMGPILCEDINEIPIISDQIVACVRKNHPWATKDFVHISDFDGVPFVSFTKGFNIYRVLANKFKEEKLVPKYVLNGVDSHFLYRYATLSNNILVLPEPMIRLICNDDPIRLIPFKPAFTWDLFLIYRKNAYVSPAARLAISHFQSYFFAKQL